MPAQFLPVLISQFLDISPVFVRHPKLLNTLADVCLNAFRNLLFKFDPDFFTVKDKYNRRDGENGFVNLNQSLTDGCTGADLYSIIQTTQWWFASGV